MGIYIETSTPTGRAQELADRHGATIVPCPDEFDAVPSDKALICVVANRTFEAAALCYDSAEFADFTLPLHEDPRPKTWLLMEKAKAHELAGYKEDSNGSTD